MRMRRKRNLDERLSNAKEYFLQVTIDDKNMKTAVLQKDYINYAEVFGNDNEVELEVGCGKGGFIIEMAKRFPDKNFIAIEKLSNIIVEGCEKAKEEGLKNVRFMTLRAECLQSYIPDNSISTIHINFPTPLPQKGYEKQRLTNKKFLQIYKSILKKDGKIYHKTDNMQLFEYSLCQLSECGYLIEQVNLDLANSDCKDNVLTEHEIKYTQMNLPIYRVVAKVSAPTA